MVETRIQMEQLNEVPNKPLLRRLKRQLIGLRTTNPLKYKPEPSLLKALRTVPGEHGHHMYPKNKYKNTTRDLSIGAQYDFHQYSEDLGKEAGDHTGNITQSHEITHKGRGGVPIEDPDSVPNSLHALGTKETPVEFTSTTPKGRAQEFAQYAKTEDKIAKRHLREGGLEAFRRDAIVTYLEEAGTSPELIEKLWKQVPLTAAEQRQLKSAGKFSDRMMTRPSVITLLDAGLITKYGGKYHFVDPLSAAIQGGLKASNGAVKFAKNNPVVGGFVGDAALSGVLHYLTDEDATIGDAVAYGAVDAVAGQIESGPLSPVEMTSLGNGDRVGYDPTRNKVMPTKGVEESNGNKGIAYENGKTKLVEYGSVAGIKPDHEILVEGVVGLAQAGASKIKNKLIPELLDTPFEMVGGVIRYVNGH